MIVVAAARLYSRENNQIELIQWHKGFMGHKTSGGTIKNFLLSH
jgi:hypothetical protein